MRTAAAWGRRSSVTRQTSARLCLLLLASLGPLTLDAQRSEDLRFGVAVRSGAIRTDVDDIAWPAGRTLPDSLRPIHPLERGAGALVLAPAGAVAGWFAFTFGAGLLSADHGRIYRRDRERAMLIMAATGLVMGWRCGWLSESLEWDCP